MTIVRLANFFAIDDEGALICNFKKINAAQDLKWANEARAKQAENLSALEQDITNLEKAAALSIARMITYPR